MVDVEAAYMFADRCTFVVGADNVFDEYPEKHFRYPEFSFGRIHPTTSSGNYDGCFCYAKVEYDSEKLIRYGIVAGALTSVRRLNAI